MGKTLTGFRMFGSYITGHRVRKSLILQQAVSELTLPLFQNESFVQNLS